MVLKGLGGSVMRYHKVRVLAVRLVWPVVL
jgi:hypothetical protein